MAKQADAAPQLEDGVREMAYSTSVTDVKFPYRIQV